MLINGNRDIFKKRFGRRGDLKKGGRRRLHDWFKLKRRAGSVIPVRFGKAHKIA